MMRITLNAILRAVFGADGEQLDELRRIIPPWVTLGSRLVVVPTPSRTFGRFSPWGRLAAYRRRYDAVIDRLIDRVEADPDFDKRDDILALLLRSTLRGRIGHVPQGHRRRAADPAGRRARDHRVRPWAGPSSGSAVIRRCWPDWWPRPPPMATNTVRPPSWRCSATAPSSTSPAATSTHRQSGWASGRFRVGTRSSWPSPRSRRPRRSSPTPDRFDPQRFVGSRPGPGLATVRRRHPALRRGGVRQRRDGCGAANGAAPLRHRHHHRTGRKGALPRRGLHPGGGRTHRRTSPRHAARSLTRSTGSRSAASGSFQPARGKWQVYPFG